VTCDCEELAESKSVEIREHVLRCHFDAAHAQLARKLLVDDADDRSDGDDGDDRDDDEEEEEEEGEKYVDQRKEQKLKELWILSRGRQMRTL